MSYPRLAALKTFCESLVGQPLLISASLGSRAPIAIQDRDIVGNVLEALLRPLLTAEFPDIERGPPQASPDFYAANKEFQFELKVFFDKPGFDLSNFTSYINQIAEPGGLEKKLFKTKYMVFEYGEAGTGFVIKRFWMLNAWQLPSYDATHPLSVQVKKGTWYNLRPSAHSQWNSTDRTAQKFITNLLKCIDECEHLNSKETLKAAITQQAQAAKTRGLL
jgi:hypothetical protein